MKKYFTRPSVRDLVLIAVLIGISVILRSLTIGTSFWKLSPGFLADSLIGWIAGPFWAGLGLAAGDVFGVLFRGAVSSPGMTVTAFIVGWLYGWAFYRRRLDRRSWRDWLFVLMIVSIIMLLQTLILNSFWLSLMYNTPFKVLLLSRLPLLIQIPIRTILIMVFLPEIMKIKKLAY
ncbi:folate family ECF transporter S component [Lactococcus termiticola]|uniref:Folate family ECF transporter S component n=1 Tax=Lactococcus termiticola TaxID=2169526 RepID=A0A2R5HDE5_9LACT|nr:folate family ECF transporter S component [Lactococcus termiticola]GBG96089.1 hypothetical protein NtB2_00193 [Lactococcus termiticola]